MFDNTIKRFGKYFASFKLDKIRKIEANQSINNLNIIPSTMIKRGHYQSRVSLNSEKPDIIRVLGPSKKKPNYFKLQDGSDKSEYEIENEYVFMETLTGDNVIPKKNIYDFEPIEPVVESIGNISNPTVQTEGQLIDTDNIEHNPNTNNIQLETSRIQMDMNPVMLDKLEQVLSNQKQILNLIKTPGSGKVSDTNELKPSISIDNPDIMDISDVIRKIHINVNHSKPHIIVPVNIPLDYDLLKVQSISDLFEFPLELVIKTILLKTLSNPDNMDLLIDNINYSIQKSLVVEVPIQLVKQPTPKQIVDNSSIDIDESISSIDDFLTQFVK